jgi:hypothetical protein
MVRGRFGIGAHAVLHEGPLESRDLPEPVHLFGQHRPFVVGVMSDAPGGSCERSSCRQAVDHATREVEVLDPGLERANLRALLGLRCLCAAADDLGHLRRCGELDADTLLGAEVVLHSEAEAVGELCDDLERMLAGGGS